MTDTGVGREIQEWRQVFLRVRLPLAAVQILLVLIMLASSAVGFKLELALMAWWSAPAIIYVFAIRTRVASWVCGPALLILTAWLIGEGIMALREWSRGATVDLGPIVEPFILPFILYFVVAGTIAVELVSLALIRRRADRPDDKTARTP